MISGSDRRVKGRSYFPTAKALKNGVRERESWQEVLNLGPRVKRVLE